MVIEDAAAGVQSPTLLILWNGTTTIIMEQYVVTICPQDELQSALLAAYFCFNISYPKGSILFYSILQILLLDRVKLNTGSRESERAM